MPFHIDGFDLQTLIAGINAAPYSPSVIQRSNLYVAKPINTTKLRIEQIGDELSLIAAQPRGASGSIHHSAGRQMTEFMAPHLVTRSALHVDSWQDQLGYGTGMLAVVSQEKDRKLSEMRQNLQTTIAFHQCRALNGQILDADGTTVLVDLLAEMGVSQQTHDMGLDDDATHVRTEVLAAKRKSERALGSATPDRWIALCSPTYFDAMSAHPAVEGAFDRPRDGAYLREDLREGFEFADVLFMEQRDLIDGGPAFIPENTAFLCPYGVPGLFETYFAPANYIEAVNEPGLPLYARAEEMKFGKGYELQAQSNPISIIRRPRAVIKLTV